MIKSLLKNYLNKELMKSYMLFVIGSLLIPICKIFNKFIKFKITVLATSRIGHLVNNYDSLLLINKEDYLMFIGQDKKIANKFIFNFYKKNKNIFFSRVFKYLFYSISQVDPNSNLIINWDEFNHEFSFDLKHQSKIILPVYSRNRISEIFSKYGLNENFVGLHARNNLYTNKYASEDKNFHDYRNFNFIDYKLAIDYLNKKKYSIVKLGETFSEESLNNFKTKIFTSNDFEANEEIDYILNKYSRYNVVGNTGLSNISSMLRKKTLYVNIAPFNLGVISTCSPGSLILPKKFYCTKKKRFLTFKENNSIFPDHDTSIHSISDPYKNKNLTVVNNSPEEILDAVIEMEEIIQNHNTNDESKMLNNLFWKKMESSNNKKEIDYLKNELKVSISSKFLKNNQNLF